MSRMKEKAFWIAIGDFGGRSLAFLTSIYLARQLGAEFYGLITVAVSILGYAAHGADLGLLNIGVREIAKEPQKREFRAKEIFNAKIALGAFVLIAATIIISNIPMGEIQRQVVLGYLYSLVPYSLLMEWYYNGNQEFGKVALSRLVNGALYLGLVFIFVNSSSDVTMVPILYTISVTSAVAVLATFSIIDKPFTLRPRGSKIYPKLLKSSSILGLGSIFAQIVQLLPPILIGALLTLSDAGIYGAAFRVVLVAMMIDRIFVNLLLPNLASIWSSDKKLAKTRVRMVLNLIIVGGVAIVMLVAINAEQIIYFLFGSEYLESAGVLKFLSPFIFLTFLNSLFSFGLIATGKDYEYFLATSFGGSIAVIIITTFAAFGTPTSIAMAVVLAELTITCFSFFWFRKVIRVKIMRSLSIMICLGGLLYISLQMLEVHYLIASVIILFVIPVASWYTKVLKIGELNWAKEKLLK